MDQLFIERIPQEPQESNVANRPSEFIAQASQIQRNRVYLLREGRACSFLKLYNKSAMTAIIYQNFQKTIESFYIKTTKDHPRKFTLRKRFNSLIASLEKECSLLPELEFRSLPPKALSQNERKQVGVEWMSVRKKAKQPQVLALNRSKSNLQKSSKDATQRGGAFNSEWIYQSEQPSKILFYAAVLSFVLNDNRLAFKYFEDKINDRLGQATHFSDYDLSIISRQWQLIGMLLSKNRPSKWRNSLRQAVTTLPAEFIELACRVMLPDVRGTGELLTLEDFSRLAKEFKVAVRFFTINYREIEHVQSLGRAGQEICIGRLKHRNVYVIANQLPEYSAQERALREVRAEFAATVNELLQLYENNSRDIAIESNSKAMKAKEAIAREFLARCLSQ